MLRPHLLVMRRQLLDLAGRSVPDRPLRSRGELQELCQPRSLKLRRDQPHAPACSRILAFHCSVRTLSRQGERSAGAGCAIRVDAVECSRFPVPSRVKRMQSSYGNSVPLLHIVSLGRVPVDDCHLRAGLLSVVEGETITARHRCVRVIARRLSRVILIATRRRCCHGIVGVRLAARRRRHDRIFEDASPRLQRQTCLS